MFDKSCFEGTSLCVVGNINRDIKTAPFAPGDYLFQDGETSVSSILETAGGGGANSAFTAAYLGAKTAFLGKVGRDALGERLEQTLIKHSISPHLARSAVATGTSINLTFANGHRHFVSSLANNETLRFEDLDLGALAGHRHLLRADIWFSEAMLGGGNEKLFRAAHEAGLEISIDLNWDPQWGRADTKQIQARKEAVRSLLKWVTLAHGNARELNEFTDSADLKTSLKKLKEWGAKAVVIHLGAEGAGYYRQGSLIVEPSVPADARVNTTGTGDVLSTCMMLSGQRTDISIQTQLKAANAIVSDFIAGKHQLIPALA
jgi:fructokinase